MRVKKRDYSCLPIDKQIVKLKFKIKFLKIFSIVWSVFVVAAAILIWVFTAEWGIAVAFLITLPFSIYVGSFWQIKEYKNKIKKLQGQENKE